MSTPTATTYPGAFTLVRAVGAPDCPFEGHVARAPDGRSVLLVDRDRLADWPGWSADVAEEHVLAPLDVVRRADGHDVVLPLLGERLDRLLARRADATPLTDGERVTVAVSILRGLSHVLLADRGVASAQWWLTDDGRPVIVEGRGDADPRRASAEVLRTLTPASSAALDASLVALVDLVTDARSKPAELDDAEDTLFPHAAPEPLATEVIGPRRVPALRPEPVAAPHETRAVRRAQGEHPAWWQRLGFHLDDALGDAASEAIDRTRRALSRRRDRGTRRLPIIVAGGAAAAVLGVGLLWPATADEAPEATREARSETVRGAGTPAAVPDVAATPVDQTAEQTPPDVALAALLDQRAACSDDTCRAAVLEDPGRVLVAGAIDAPAASRSIALIDDLGGLAVLRVSAADASAPDQFVTIVAGKDGWRVRDAYVVANPPS